jgi:hypothetical protein
MSTRNVNRASLPDCVDTCREIVKQSLQEIARQIEERLQAANLDCPVFISVPRSGDAIAQMATPIDPTDEVWAKVTQIVHALLSERLGGMSLIGNGLDCALANKAISPA